MNEDADVTRGENPAANALVARATAGDRAALDVVIRTIQADVYNLAVRMLWCPEDAADATSHQRRIAKDSHARESVCVRSCAHTAA